MRRRPNARRAQVEGLKAWAVARGRSAVGVARRQLRRPIVWLPLLFVVSSGSGLALGSWQNLCVTCPSIAQIKTWEPAQASKLLAHDGRLIVEMGSERRTPISIAQIPPYVGQAVIAIEDHRFYEHGGFDPRGFMRAIFGVLTFQNLGGGSTITQQLARNIFEQVGMQRGLLGGGVTRKFREIQVAFQLEASYSKDQILEAYLNQIYMGRGHGFQEAAQGYLGKDIKEVDVAEAALLAAILNRPGAYDPVRHPDNALARRNLVLDRMSHEGYLSDEDAEKWKEAPLPTEDFARAGVYGPAPYFEEWVRQILDDRFGEDVVYRGGLRIYTTLDLDVQKAAVESMNWGWQRIEENPSYKRPKFAQYDTVTSFPQQTPYAQGGLIALDPQTGHVLAMIGGRDFEQSKFDHVRLAERQAGSSFKPFVYTAAIAAGIPASHVIADEPFEYPEADGTVWRPKNFDAEFSGPLTLREALRRSINMVAVRLGWEEVGIDAVRQTAQRMGIRSTTIEPFPSTTIGAVSVRPIELAEAYSAFATLGTRVTPFPILKVENALGEVVWEPQPERAVVLDSLVARLMVDLLQDAANRGTGGSHRTTGGLPADVPTAGKTGTTNDCTDMWFNGFTPNLLAIVWFGMDRPVSLMQPCGTVGTGSFLGAPVWGRFMNQVYYGLESAKGAAKKGALPIPDPWPLPVELTTRDVDKRTGRLWASGCSGAAEFRYTEYFIPGTEPTETCEGSGRPPQEEMR
jgi:1A family penicillin-binding protein